MNSMATEEKIQLTKDWIAERVFHTSYEWNIKLMECFGYYPTEKEALWYIEKWENELKGIQMSDQEGYVKPTTKQQVFVDDFTKKEHELLALIESLKQGNYLQGRWAAIATTHFEEGFMAIRRSIIKPDEK